MKFLAAAMALASLAGRACAADAAHPTVVELFQSQGCSSCQPANANLIAIADRPDILALTWEVTYWDYLGWKDSFGDHAFTARQYDYAASLGQDGVFTPEIVVNGRAAGVGRDAGELASLVRQADRGGSGPALVLAPDHVGIGQAAGAGQVLLVRYDPNLVQVAIHAGENGGRTLPHRNVVRQVIKLGDWTGQPASFAIPPADRAGLATAILLQAGRGGAILAAVR